MYSSTYHAMPSHTHTGQSGTIERDRFNVRYIFNLVKCTYTVEWYYNQKCKETEVEQYYKLSGRKPGKVKEKTNILVSRPIFSLIYLLSGHKIMRSMPGSYNNTPNTFWYDARNAAGLTPKKRLYSVIVKLKKGW